DAACARLAQLARLGSAYACWLLGDRLARGDGLEKDEEAARPLLEKAASAGIGAACWRLHCLDGERAAGSELLREGIAAGSVRCARALAMDWKEGGSRLDKREAGLICDLLLEAAREGSWPCLEALLPLLDRCPKLWTRTKERMDALTLTGMAARSGIVPAMVHLGRQADGNSGRESGDAGRHWLEQARDAGSVEAVLALSEQAVRAGRLEEALRMLDVVRHDCRALCLAGYLLYRGAGNRRSAEKAAEIMQQAIRDGAADLAAEKAWIMCLALNAGEGVRKDGLKLLRAAVEEGSREALVSLAHLRLIDLTGEEDSVRLGLDLLESLRDSDGRACGMLAETYLLGLYGVPADMERGLALACEGYARDDLRSSVLLLLNRKSRLGGEVCADNPVSGSEIMGASLFLAGRDDIMMMADAALGRLAVQFPLLASHAEAGLMLAASMLRGLAARDMAVLTLIAAGAPKFGDSPPTRTAARAFSDVFQMESTPLGSFTTWEQVIAFTAAAVAKPEAALNMVMDDREGGSGPSRGSGRTAAKRSGSARRKARNKRK
ncbi:MAG: hypothetical protein Q4F72_07800, partial [Desulfovibrionaceae bacterium]|nr:hypothetical protein [Desulfovibrionaceae bacterium]